MPESHLDTSVCFEYAILRPFLAFHCLPKLEICLNQEYIFISLFIMNL